MFVLTDVTDNPQSTRAEQMVSLGALRVWSRRDGDVHTIGLAGELDLVGAGEVDRELERAQASDAAAVVVDLSKLTFIDSTGIRLLVKAERRSREDSCRLRIVPGPPAVQRTFELCGVVAVLPFTD